MEEEVILVDTNDKAIGVIGKLEAHKQGLLHRAFSVFIFNSKNELLLQQRAFSKYHSAALWTNTCCSHPRPGETTSDAAKRRLLEEMGLTTSLQHKTQFIYKTTFNNALTEYELDHVFVGTCDALPEINREEVNSFRYLSIDAVKNEIRNKPEEFTSWFKIALEKFF